MDFHYQKKGTCYHFIDDVRVRVCPEDGLNDSSFFWRLNFWVLAHDCDQVERKCDQKNGTRDNSATGTEKIFRALHTQSNALDRS